MRRAVLDGRLWPGTRLPATRDFARQYGVSRGTAVTVFEQLLSEGYLRSRVGAGTWINELLPRNLVGAKRLPTAVRSRPARLARLTFPHPARPFRAHEPALAEFPVEVWARIASRRLRRVSCSLLAGGDARGYGPLCTAIAEYLGSSRGVNCSPERVVIVSGVQQALDLLARLLLKPGDAVWMEDPGYFGAITAFTNVGARIIPVPVDEHGISVSKGKQLCPRAKGAYLTPAHQFPMGMTMPLERRLAILRWAHDANAFLIEDDYDSEFRFEGRPIPSLQGLDKSESVILLGTFNKLLFPSLRLGYVVLPAALVDPFLSFRYGTDLHPAGLDQAILCDFIVEGHMGRHIRRMRELYAGRLAALQALGQRYLGGLLDISPVQVGLYTAGFLRHGMTSGEAETRAAEHGIETMALDRFTLKRADVHGLLLGFAAFDERQIRRGLEGLAVALDSGRSGTRSASGVSRGPVKP
jgi:GntR family transcriptional regulator/MocR family aminotransferase